MPLIKILTEGGQIWTHRFRMVRQVCKIAMLGSLIVAASFFAFHMNKLPIIYYQGAWYHLKSEIVRPFLDEIEVDKKFWITIAHTKHQHNPHVKTDRLSTLTKPFLNRIVSDAVTNLEKAYVAFGVSFVCIIVFFFVRGTAWQRKKHLSGNKLVPAWWLALRLKLSGKASKIQIGSLPLLKNSETRHLLMTGGTGSGKTNCLFHILDQLRQLGKKVIIVDTTGVFIEKYYRKDKDIILNPTDPRSATWHPWIECHDKFDYEALAESFIPHSHSEHENYWRIAARALFSALLAKTHLSQSTSELARWSLFEPITKLCEFVQGTKAAAHIDMNSEKTASSIRSVASSFLGSLEILNDTKQPFSIRNWVQSSNDDSWLFLSCLPSQRSTLIPLLGCWFSVATRSLMHLKPDFERRLWYVIDELPSLNKLRDLETFLAEGRKFGGCDLLSLQTPSQLDAIYGKDSTKTILSNCATKVVFAEHNPESAANVSKVFGDREIQEFSEGLSYGAHEVRDGVTISSQKKSLPIVSTNDIMSLDPNRAFVKLPGKFPITTIKLDIKSHK
jgi:type IV conjugative transfer system coupling protein TraD